MSSRRIWPDQAYDILEVTDMKIESQGATVTAATRTEGEQRRQTSLYPDVKTQYLSRDQKLELLTICDELKALSGGSAACADALDFLGYRRTAMDPAIKPYFPDKGRMCGLAYTIRGAN